MTVHRPTVNIKQACQLVGVSRRTIYNWLEHGKVQYVRTAGGHVRIFADTLWRSPQHRPGVPEQNSPFINHGVTTDERREEATPEEHRN